MSLQQLMPKLLFSVRTSAYMLYQCRSFSFLYLYYCFCFPILPSFISNYSLVRQIDLCRRFIELGFLVNFIESISEDTLQATYIISDLVSTILDLFIVTHTDVLGAHRHTYVYMLVKEIYFAFLDTSPLYRKGASSTRKNFHIESKYDQGKYVGSDI